jgi:hypothetical protein
MVTLKTSYQISRNAKATSIKLKRIQSWHYRDMKTFPLRGLRNYCLFVSRVGPVGTIASRWSV